MKSSFRLLIVATLLTCTQATSLAREWHLATGPSIGDAEVVQITGSKVVDLKFADGSRKNFLCISLSTKDQRYLDYLANSPLSVIFVSKTATDDLPSANFQPNIVARLGARAFERGQFGAALKLGGPSANKSLKRMLIDNDIGIRPDDVVKAVGVVLPIIGMARARQLDILGLGQMGQGSNYAEMMRPAMGQYGQANTGLTPEEMTGRAVALGKGINSRLFGANGDDFSQTMGIRHGEGSALLRHASEKGYATSGTALLGTNDLGKASDIAAREQKSLSQGSAAVRDLGGPYAAMNSGQRLDTLNALSMGRLKAGENAGELGMGVRRFGQSLQQAGVSIEGGKSLMDLAGARSVQLGGNMKSGTVGGHHAAAYGAFLNSAEGAGYTKASGVSAQKLMQQDAVLTAQAGRSGTAQNAAALMEMGNTGMLGKKGEAFDAYTALKGGKYNALGGDGMRKMLARSGVDMSAAGAIMANRKENLNNHGDAVAGAVRAEQWKTDVAPSMSRNIANRLGQAAGGAWSGRKSQMVGNAVTEFLHTQGGKSQKEMQAGLFEKFKESGMSDAHARTTASVSIGAAGAAADRRGYEGLGNVLSQHSQGAMKGVADQEAYASVAAQRNAARVYK